MYQILAEALFVSKYLLTHNHSRPWFPGADSSRIHAGLSWKHKSFLGFGSVELHTFHCFCCPLFSNPTSALSPTDHLSPAMEYFNLKPELANKRKENEKEENKGLAILTTLP